MLKMSIQILGFLAVSTLAAGAACPTIVPGNTSEAIQANRARIQCLQAEVDAQADRRRLELELRMQQTAIQQLQLQRRFDQLKLEPRRF